MQIQNIKLDFCRNDYRAITVKQYDADSRHVLITCTNNDSVYKLDPSTQKCNVKMMTPDNRAIWDDHCVSITEDGKVLVTFTENMVMANGTGQLEIQVIEKATYRELSTMILTVVIVGSVYSNDTIIASDEFNILTDVLKEVEDAVEAAKNVNDIIDNINNLESDVEASEAARKSAEVTRQSNEAARESNEAKRISNEANRQSVTSTAILNAENAAERANAAAEDAVDAANKAKEALTNKVNVSDVIDDLDEIKENTDTGKVAGALVVKELLEGAISGGIGDDVVEIIEAEVDKVRDEFIPHNESKAAGAPRQAGWYRIAQLNAGSANKAMGTTTNSAEIILKRDYQNNESEYHRILFRQVYYNSEFVPVEAKNVIDGSHIIMQIRHVVDATNGMGYIDIYYRANVPNCISVQINDAVSAYDSVYWEAVAPELVSEDIGDAILYTVVDLPINCKPTTTKDNLNTMSEVNANTSADKIAGALAVKELSGQLGKIKYKEIWVDSNEYPTNIDAIKSQWETFDLDSIYLVRLSRGSQRIAIVQKYSKSHDYGAVIIFGYSSNIVELHTLSAGTWDYREFATTSQLVNYLPLTGGNIKGTVEIDGILYVETVEGVWFTIQTGADGRKISMVSANNMFGFNDDTHKRWIMRSEGGADGRFDIYQKLYVNEKEVATTEWTNTQIADRFNVNKVVIDLTDTSKYDESTYYPVYGTRIGMGRNHRLTCTAVLYDSGTPSWSTHEGGFFATVDIMDCGVSWGARTNNTIILDNDYKYVSSGSYPIRYHQLTNSSTPVFYVRGGGKYNFYADYVCIWTLATSEIGISEQTIKPETSVSTTEEYNSHAIVLEYLRGKLDRSGDTMTGQLTIDRSSSTSNANLFLKSNDRQISLAADSSSNKSNAGIYDETNHEWILRSDSDGKVYIPHDLIIQNNYANAILKNGNREAGMYLAADGTFGLYDTTNDKWLLWSHKSGGANIPGTLNVDNIQTSGDVTANGLIKSDSYDCDLVMGAQNETYCHMYADLPFYFNKDIYVNGDKLGKEVHSHNCLKGYVASTTNPSSTAHGELMYGYNLNSDKCGALPKTNNANGVMTINTHSGNYYHQFGFSSNNNLYHRAVCGVALSDSVSWGKVLKASDFTVTGSASSATLTINLD